jgi:signal transduction histidine kinase
MARRRAPDSVAAPVLQFAITGALAVLLLGFVAVTLLRHTGTQEAIRDARQVTRLAGEGIVAPAISPALQQGDPRAIRAMDHLVHASVVSAPLVRVKIWDASGRIMYSDEHRLIGARYPLDKGELGALRSGTAQAEVSDLSRPENRFERPRGKLLEVYLGVRAPNGRRLLFEGYETFSSVSASGKRLWERFLPALIGAMVLLELAQIPLAWSLARRLQRGQRDREALWRRSVEASDTERRKIAGELHDSTVQNLAGLSYSLAAAAEQLPPDSPVRASVVDGAAQARGAVRELRSLLVDIYPPALHQAGLRAALDDLTRTRPGESPQVRLDVDQGLDLPPEVEALVFRAAQEALRNVKAHSGASSAELRVVASEGGVTLEVSDDGRGFAPGNGARRDNGHFGLTMLADMARDAGGAFEVDSAEGRGTRVRLEVPLS